MCSLWCGTSTSYLFAQSSAHNASISTTMGPLRLLITHILSEPHDSTVSFIAKPSILSFFSHKGRLFARLFRFSHPRNIAPCSPGLGGGDP